MNSNSDKRGIDPELRTLLKKSRSKTHGAETKTQRSKRLRRQATAETRNARDGGES